MKHHFLRTQKRYACGGQGFPAGGRRAKHLGRKATLCQSHTLSCLCARLCFTESLWLLPPNMAISSTAMAVCPGGHGCVASHDGYLIPTCNSTCCLPGCRPAAARLPPANTYIFHHTLFSDSDARWRRDSSKIERCSALIFVRRACSSRPPLRAASRQAGSRCT